MKQILIINITYFYNNQDMFLNKYNFYIYFIFLLICSFN